MIKSLLKRVAGGLGYRVLTFRGNYHADNLFTYHSDAFRREPGFRKAYARGLKTVTLDPGHEWRVHIALWCASTAARLEGDFVECGVFVGFISSAIMEHLGWDSLGKTFWLVDTFEGPKVEQFTTSELERGRAAEVEALRKVGGYDYSFEGVRANFAEWRNARLVKGLVPDVLPQCGSSKVAYLHLDMNAVVPETAALRFFWDRLVPGGMVLMDDYCYAGFDEQRQGLDKAAAELGVGIVSLPTGQGLLIKPPQPHGGRA